MSEQNNRPGGPPDLAAQLAKGWRVCINETSDTRYQLTIALDELERIADALPGPSTIVTPEGRAHEELMSDLHATVVAIRGRIADLEAGVRACRRARARILGVELNPRLLDQVLDTEEE